MPKNDTAQANGPSKDTKKLRKMIKNTRIAMLTTVTSDGLLRSRPMATLKAPFDGYLWFLARTAAPMAEEIKDNQRVGVSYSSPEDDRYVSVTGVATLVRDQDKVRELWSRRLKPWFPEGKNDPELALIRVSVERADYWDSKQGSMVHLSGAEQASAAARADARNAEEVTPPGGGGGAQA